MLQQLLLSFVLASATVAIHVVGTIHLVVPWVSVWRERGNGQSKRPVVVLIRLTSGLLILHIAAMSLWAVAFHLFGLFSDVESSFYFSFTSYTTVGYGDVVLQAPWRLIGPIEAVVGVLMLGLSTGVIVAAVQRLYQVK